MTPVSSILQFGTSRFLQAHVDLFVSEALERGEAIGTIAVVQTTSSPSSAGRIAAMARGQEYPVRIRGIRSGQRIDDVIRVRSVRRALQAAVDWREVRRIAVAEAEVVISNTGDQGFALDPADGPDCVANEDAPPGSFPAKLLALLHARWTARPGDPLSIFPCELVSRNGERLQAIVVGLAEAWALPDGFLRYLRTQCRWANSLVDRIVSEPLEPVGAVAEPYALWAIERQDGLLLPCRHPAIVVTDDLDPFERLKLHILNLGHTMLAEMWRQTGSDADLTVVDAMERPAMRTALEAIWNDEVIPVFAGNGLEEQARAYRDNVRERFLNPFLAHRLADIAQNHQEKKRRRLAPLIAAAEHLQPPLSQPRLRAAMQEHSHG
jgi:tagaturonate reductase